MAASVHTSVMRMFHTHVIIISVLWISWIHLSIQNESIKQISLNEYISNARCSFYIYQAENKQFHKQRRYIWPVSIPSLRRKIFERNMDILPSMVSKTYAILEQFNWILI
jgi:hypothetical protein